MGSWDKVSQNGSPGPVWPVSTLHHPLIRGPSSSSCSYALSQGLGPRCPFGFEHPLPMPVPGIGAEQSLPAQILNVFKNIFSKNQILQSCMENLQRGSFWGWALSGGMHPTPLRGEAPALLSVLLEKSNPVFWT